MSLTIALDFVKRYTPKLFIDPSLRLYCLRGLLLTSFYCVVGGRNLWDIVEGEIWPANVALGLALFCQCIVLVHHSLIALGPRLVPIPLVIDFVLTLVESAYALTLVVIFGAWKSAEGVELRWTSKRDIASLTAYIAFLTFLLATMLLKVLDLASASQPLWRPTTYIQLPTGDENQEGRLSSKIRYAVRALLGTKPWEEKVPGESWISKVRGFFTVGVIVGLVILGAYQALVLPIVEMGLTPTREVRASGSSLPPSIRNSRPIIWNLVVGWKNGPRRSSPLINATEVLRHTDSSMCRSYEPRLDLNHPMEVVVFRCRGPTFADISTHPGTGGATFDDIYQSRFLRPDLSLRVNFSALIGREDGDHLAGTNWAIDNSVQVYLAHTDDIVEVLRSTRPTPLFPGTSILSVATPKIRQRQESLRASTFGMGGALQTFMVSDIAYTSPYPASDDPQPFLGTMRITADDDYEGEWIVIQDFRSKTVLSGLAMLGGLGTFASALLLYLFGTDLLRTLRGSKPYNPFGAIHNLDSVAAQVFEECKKRYPAIQDEVLSFGDENKRGVVAFLLDTLIDVRALGFSDTVANIGNPVFADLTEILIGSERGGPHEGAAPIVQEEDSWIPLRNRPPRRSTSILLAILTRERVIPPLIHSAGTAHSGNA